MNLKNPETFNEKINYLKLHERPELGEIIADKIKVRDYVSSVAGEKYLIPVIGVFERSEDIDFEKLPRQFALKTNHGSGWNIICRDKTKLHIHKAHRKLKRWLKRNAYYLSREWQYKNLKPMIICEELLEFDIIDYKFFCFNGIPEFVQLDIDRFTDHTRIYYSTSWERLDFSVTYHQATREIEKPSQIEEMLSLSTKLSKGFLFSRIDLYLHNNKIYFGEITLHPEGGFGPFIPEFYNKIIGDKLKIS